MSQEGLAPKMKKVIANIERKQAYFDDPETQKALAGVSEKMSERQRDQSEVDPTSEEGKETIIIAADDHIMDATYSVVDGEVVMHYDFKDFPQSEPYKALEHLYRTLDLTDEADKIQAAYEATKIWSDEEKEQIAQYMQEEQVRADGDYTVAMRDDSEESGADTAEPAAGAELTPDTVPHESLPDVVEASEDPVEPFEIKQSAGMQHFNALHAAAVESKKRADLAPEALDAAETSVAITDNSDTQQSLESNFSDPSAGQLKEESVATVQDETAEQATAARLEQNVSDASAATNMEEHREAEALEVETEQLSDVETRKLIYKEIDRIEAPSRFFRWLRSPSPIALLEDTPFEQFAVLLELSKRDFNTLTANEYRGMDLDYGPFQKWAHYLDTLNTPRQTGIDQLSRFADSFPPSKRTTKTVMEGFIAQQLGL